MLKEERAALGPVRIDFDEDEGNSPHGPPRENYYVQMAIFAKPIAIGGLPIIGYSQRYVVREGEAPSWYIFELQVAWPAERVGQALETRLGVKFDELRSFGWSNKEAVEDGRVSSDFGITGEDAPEGQSSLRCQVSHADTPGFRPPHITALFGAPELKPLPLGDADRLMNGLLACTPEFFDLLKAEQEAFGAVKISRISLWGKRNEPIETRVEFSSIVHAWGLDLTAYFQRVDRSAGRERISWGFETAEWEDPLWYAIRQRTGSGYVEGQGWIVDLQTEETGYTPSQNFSIRDAGSREGGRLVCSFNSDDFTAAALPDPSDLFLTAPR
ncbi:MULTISPECIES: hypothetical protein [unclassified Sinorhizobium]|uniref:hypothetical protein n=1 Tax=unclassified Sinorhizobium TaxID=2613772 RepID=UPI0024C33428|nr:MULTISPECIES: hypothetical protein [unclassified Sinorhizobium]MDK1373354.1 hypothetical protein [Sinorhizobium sp. 6-70]MDK1481175.1 hypothetical protein [Sinorhizobium sp. 6-117]